MPGAPQPLITHTQSRIPHILRSRQRRAPGRSAARLGMGCSTIASLGLVLFTILVAVAYADLTRDLPPVQTLEALLEPPDGALLEPTRIYDRYGVHILTLQALAAAERQYLRFLPPEFRSAGDPTVLPESLMTATLAASDPDFWAHPGFPIPSLHKTDRLTLAQRLVSDLLLSDEAPSLRRDLRERLLAAQVTTTYGRIKVLEWYLNSAYYGHLAYGADAASRVYFDKPAAQLNLAEAAALAAVAEAPNLNPFDAPQEALARQKIVIQNMLSYRMISPEEGIEAIRQRLDFRTPENSVSPAAKVEWAYDITNLSQYPAFLEMVIQQIEDGAEHRQAISRRQLERGGLRVYTTLDGDLQAQAVCALQVQITQLTGQPFTAPDSKTAALCDSEGSPDGKDNQIAARLLPTLGRGENHGSDANPGDASPIATSSALAADLVILDPLTGQVLALVGVPPIDGSGVNRSGGVNPATASILSARPAGSLSTSFIYLTAFTRGLSPASLVWDIPGAAGAVTQELASAYLGPLRLRIAQANDYRNPAQTVLALVGVENVWSTARQFSLLPPAVPLAGAASQSNSLPSVDTLLGDVNLLSVSQAFGALANQGVLVGKAIQASSTSAAAGVPAPLQPVAVLRVEEVGSESVRLQWKTTQTRPILTAQLAYLMTDVLSDEPARWPSLGHPNPLEIGRPAAARLASSASSNSSWAIGYTPQRVTGVWLGSADTATESNLWDSRLTQAAAGLWHALMQYATRDLPAQEWSVPAGISRLRVCDPSGMLPTRSCPNLVEEIFLSGSEPVQYDTLYQAVPVNRQTGRLATVFTPLDLVEPRVFFIAPPEAQTWVSQSGLELPPQVYDTIPLETPHWPDANLTEPQMFAILRGTVRIHGTASGDDFSYFRLQVGQGMNPQRWLQIGADGDSPLTNGLLAVWDTAGLDGLYAIQLLVVKSDQSLRRTTLLVTIDNTPPQLEIKFPTTGAQISLDRGRVIFQIDVRDELGLQEVAFYIDNTRLATFSQPPYAAGWQATPGAHTLRVIATDQAGNSTQSTVEFSVPVK